MAIKIYGFDRSNTTWAARLAAVEKGVAHELHVAQPHSPEIYEMSPLGKIPAMRDGDLVLFESMPICRYINENFDGPPLMPAEKIANIQLDQWVAVMITAADTTLIRNYIVEYLFNKDDDGNVVRHAIDRAIAKFPTLFKTLNAAVKDGFMGSDQFSLADCHAIPILSAVGRFPESNEELARHADLSDYVKRMQTRPSFAETVPKG